MVGVSLWITLVYLISFSRCAKYCPEICSCLGDYVDCAQKNLVSIPSSIPKSTVKLNLNNNQIGNLTDASWHNLSKLMELKLNRNNISTIPKDFFDNLKRLKTLELNRNQLRDIDALTFKSLGQLITLRLKRNNISQLKDGAFFGLEKIKSLILDYNKIRVISKGWLYGLNSLKELSLSNNVIDQIEMDAWEFCPDLVQLDLSYNQMTVIKADTFKYLKHLTKLILNNNNIKFIEENTFTHLPKLKILYFNYNDIAWTIEDANGVFQGLSSLQQMHLAWNNIKSVNKNAFVGLNNLEHLDLRGNNVTSIQNNAFSEMPLLKNVSLNTTSLLCDCNIRWFAEWVQESKFKIMAVCSYPEQFRGMPLLDVPMTNFSCDEVPKPRLIEQPAAHIMALKGEDVHLGCKAVSSSSSNMTFQWKKDNVELENANSMVSSVMLDGNSTQSFSNLTIYKVQHGDAGKYQCVVSNEYGTVYSMKSSISVLIFPTFVQVPKNITVRAGDTVKLECAAYGEPQPEIAWQKDGGNDFPAARERRMHVMPTDDVFFIINAKPSDMGNYSCTAHNVAGTITANASLTIEEMPYFTHPMKNKEVNLGDTAVINCNANGTPEPTIKWLKDGGPINMTERHFFTLGNKMMIIVDTLPSDAGTYQCQLNNSLGHENGYSHLKVNSNVINTSDMWGIIIITVVCCAVLTSIIWVVIIYQTRRSIPPSNTIAVPADQTAVPFTDTHFPDNASENSSCKDSGTGDSAKRSNDDLMPEEYVLIVNENITNDKGTMRTASVIYPACEANTSHTPLLHTSGATYTRSTNHDRTHGSQSEDVTASSHD